MPHDGFRHQFSDHLAREHGIGRLAGSLKEIVYGGNDGIVTTFAVVAGFAGAALDSGTTIIGGTVVLLFGLANLLADAAAMGLGAFLSARSERDVYESHRAKELHEITHNPDFERREVIEILTARGVSTTDAQAFADLYQRNPELMADFMMHYEVGLPDARDSRPALDGLMTFGSFMVFGSIPLLPYMVLPAVPSTFQVSVVATGLALLLLGVVRGRVTGHGMGRSIAETMAIGGTCASLAYLVGLFFRL